MKKILLFVIALLIIGLGYFVYNQNKVSDVRFDALASNDDLMTVNIVNSPDQLREWSENSIFQHLLQFQEITEIRALYDSMHVSMDDDAQLGFYIRKNGEYLIAVDTKKESSKGLAINSNKEFKKKVGDVNWHVRITNGLYLVSKSEDLLKLDNINPIALEKSKWNTSFLKFNTKDLFANNLEYSKLNELLNLFTASTNYSVSFTDDKLNSSGFDFSKRNGLNKLLKGQEPQEFNLSENLILDFNSIKTLFFSSGEDLHLANEKATTYPTSIFDGLQVAEIDFKTKLSDKIIVLKSETIEELYSISTEREKKKLKSVFGFDIFEVTSENLIDDLFQGYFTTFAHYAVFRGDMMLVASNPKALEDYLGKLSHNQVWFQSYDQMKWVEQELIANNSMFLYGAKSYESDFQSQPVLEAFYTRNKDLINSMPYVLIQQSMEGEGIYTGASLTFSQEVQSDVRAEVIAVEETPEALPKAYTLASFKTKLVSKPIAVKNYSTGAVQFLLIDDENTIRSVTNSGKTDWKFTLDGTLVSEIYEIDVFKNKKIQYVFATDKKVYCVDRLGNMVENFPIYLPSKAQISGFNLIDYNQSRDYRLAINADKKIWLYDVDAKALDGWNPLALKSEIKGNVKHFRYKTKDYLVALEKSGMINVLKRKGVPYNGFPIAIKHSFKDNNTILDKGLTTKDTRLSFLSANGMTSKYNLEGTFYTVEKIPLPGDLQNVFVETKNGNTRYATVYKNDVYVFDEKLEQKHVLKEVGNLKGFQMYDLSGEEVYVFIFDDHATLQTVTGKVLIENISTLNEITLYYSSTNSRGFVYYTSGTELKKQGFKL